MGSIKVRAQSIFSRLSCRGGGLGGKDILEEMNYLNSSALTGSREIPLSRPQSENGSAGMVYGVASRSAVSVRSGRSGRSGRSIRSLRSLRSLRSVRSVSTTKSIAKSDGASTLVGPEMAESELVEVEMDDDEGFELELVSSELEHSELITESEFVESEPAAMELADSVIVDSVLVQSFPANGGAASGARVEKDKKDLTVVDWIFSEDFEIDTRGRVETYSGSQQSSERFPKEEVGKIASNPTTQLTRTACQPSASQIPYDDEAGVDGGDGGEEGGYLVESVFSASEMDENYDKSIHSESVIDCNMTFEDDADGGGNRISNRSILASDRNSQGPVVERVYSHTLEINTTSPVAEYVDSAAIIENEAQEQQPVKYLDTTIPENQHQHVESIDATRPRDYTQEHLPQEPIGFIFSDNKIETHIPVEHVSPTVSKDQTRVEESIYSTGFDEQTRGHVSAEPANSSVFDTQRQVNIQVDSIDSTGSEQQVRGHLTPKSIDTAGPMENTQAGVSMETADAASSENQTETSLPIDSIDSTSTEERTQVNLAKESLDSTSPAEQIQLDLPLEFVDSASCEDHREMQTLEESTNSTGPDDEIRADLPMEPIDSAGPGEEKEVGLTVEYAHATDSEDQTQDDPSKVCIEPAYQEGQRQEELPEGSLNPAGSEGLTDVQPIVESVETAGSEDQIQPGAGPSEESIDSMSSQNQIHEDTPADQIDVHQQVENFDSADSGDQTQAFPHIDFTRSEGQREVERPVEFEDSAGSDFTVPNEYVHDDVRLYTPRSESERVICSILVAIQDADEELLRNIITGNQNTQIDINMAGISARPLLLSASTTQNHQLLTQLLTHRIQNQGDYNHTIWTPLICAIVKNQAGIVQHLLARQDIDVNRSNREQGTTPLLAAVLARNLEISRLLLERRDVDLNKTNEQGNSPLSTALCNYVSSEKTTELQTESAEILRMFLNRNDIDLNRHFKYPICSIVGDRSNAVDETALHFAILTQSEVAAQWLLERTDVDPNKGNSEGETPLSAAIRVAVENSDSQRNILRVLLKRQDLDINKSTNNEKFPPALHVAIRTGIIEIVEMLLSRGDVNVHVLDRENGIGATNFAEQLGNQDIIHLLRSRGG